MPNRRITIVLNSNQSKRITVLVPLRKPGEEDYNVKEHILLHARNKFRDKYLSTLYFWGGEELKDGDVLPDKEEEVLVSKGEAYIGPPKKKTRADGETGEVRVLANASFIHEEATKQLEQIAELEGVYATIGMPDLHKGDRFPIGCAILSKGIYPALIGSDIGCGISVYPLGSKPAHLTPEKLASRLKQGRLDEPWEQDVKSWLRWYGITEEEETEFDKDSLGTVGAGNHFAEVLEVETIVDSEACDSMGIKENELYLMVHTGSRGLGASILRHYTKSDGNPYLTNSDPEFDVYLSKHDHAVIWARANRDLLAHRIRDCIFGRRLGLGSVGDDHVSTEDDDDAPPGYEVEELAPSVPPAAEKGELSPSVLSEAEKEDPRDALGKILDVTHNSVTRCGYEVEGELVDTWLHRKGAAPTDQGFVPCPGSRGDFSWILQPRGEGHFNGYSLAHGAGRLHPRNAQNLRRGRAEDLNTTSFGSYVVCTDPELLIQERPEAYKNIQATVDDLEEQGVAEGVAKLRPYVTFKTALERRK